MRVPPDLSVSLSKVFTDSQFDFTFLKYQSAPRSVAEKR